MKDSMTYQATLEDGRVEFAQRMILRLGTLKFGPPGETIPAVIMDITDRERLERMAEVILVASSWDQVLAVPEADEPVVVSSAQTSGTSR